jgi:hypothetical protein
MRKTDAFEEWQRLREEERIAQANRRKLLSQVHDRASAPILARRRLLAEGAAKIKAAKGKPCKATSTP